jgi:2-dehydropantoate 2-reductase
VDDDRGMRVVPVDARRAEDVDGKIDMILLFTKAMHSAAAMQSAAHLVGEDTCVLTLQNGLGNVEAIAAVVPQDRILQGVTDVPSDLIDSTTVASHGKGNVWLGSLTGNQALADGAVALFQQAGLTAVHDAQVQAAVWEKIAFNAALNAVATVTLLPVGRLASGPARRLVDGASAEALTVAGAMGIGVDRQRVAAKIAYATAHHGDHKPSMLQDRLAGRLTEITAINGAIVAAGERVKVPTPINSVLTDIVKAIEGRD